MKNTETAASFLLAWEATYRQDQETLGVAPTVIEAMVRDFHRVVEAVREEAGGPAVSGDATDSIRAARAPRADTGTGRSASGGGRMNLNELAIVHESIVERVSPHGLLSLVEPVDAGDGRRWTGQLIDFDDHASLELHGLREEQVRAILAALSGEPGREVITHLRHEAGRVEP